jgi:hypothetical protein
MPAISWSVITASHARGSSPDPAEAPPNRVEMAMIGVCAKQSAHPDVSQSGLAMQRPANPARINPSMGAPAERGQRDSGPLNEIAEHTQDRKRGRTRPRESSR